MRSNTSLLLFVLIAFIILAPIAFAEDLTPHMISDNVSEGGHGIESKAMTQLSPGKYELYYDDGTAEGSISWSVDTTNHYLAVKFNISNPLYYPIIIDKIGFFARTYFNGPVKLVVFDSDSTTFLWNSSILEPRSLPPNGEWIEVNCGLVVRRDFYIAVYYMHVDINGWTSVGLDKDSPSGHSYYGPPMVNWPPPPYQQVPYPDGNLMIRAVVSKSSPVGGRLEDSTFVINFLPTTLFLMPIIVLSAYLLLARRRKVRL